MTRFTPFQRFVTTTFFLIVAIVILIVAVNHQVANLDRQTVYSDCLGSHPVAYCEQVRP